MEWKINMIENMTEETAKENAEESLDIKGFAVYLIDFKGYYGYSALVFKNGHHIRYADDYALHHLNTWTKETLRDWYIGAMNRKLYTEEELKAPISDYAEYTMKRRFLINYYPMQTDYVSCYGNFSDKEYVKAYRKKTADMHLNPYSFCYMSDPEFINQQGELIKALEKRKEELSENYAYNKEAFKNEMYNHEYAINSQADHDTLSAFGPVGWHDDLDSYFEELKFTETQKKAYLAARKEVMRAVA